jgi:hypothetical protein
MAKSSQFTSVSSSSGVGGNTQAVVELHDVCGGGLTFWARQKFRVGAELYARLRTEVLPSLRLTLEGEDVGEWLILRGFVVDCQAQRRADGSCGFRVSVLIADRVENHSGMSSGHSLSHLCVCHKGLSGHQVGLN